MVKKQNKQILINMATGWLPVVTSLIVFFFLKPYMMGKMGVALIGAWALINQLTAHLVLVQSVAGGAITKYVAQHHANNDNKSLRRVINTGIAEYLLLAVIAAIIGLFLCLIAGKFPAFGKLDSDVFLHARIALALMVVNLVINLPFLGIRATIAGFQRYDFLNLVMTVSEILRAIGILVTLACGYGLVALSLCIITVSIFSNAISLIFLLKIHPFSFSRHDCQWSLMKTLFNFGFFSLITAAASMIFHRIDSIVISAVLVGLTHIAIYDVGISLLTTIRSICQPVISVIMPVASELSTLPSDQRREKLEELFTRGSRFPLILTLPITLFFIVFGREFISLWLGPEFRPYARQSHLIFVILALPAILTISWQAGAQMLIGLAKHRFPAYLFCVAAAVNLGLSLILIRYWGIVGVALGTAIPEMLIKPIMHFYYKKVFDIPMGRYYWNVWSRILPLGLGLTALMFYQKQYAHYFNLPELLLVAAIDGLLFWVISYWILDSYERHVVRQVIKRIFKKP